MIRTIHRAKYVLADCDLILQDAAIHVCDPGRICRVEPWHGTHSDLAAEVLDWGSSAIIPGFVNAHTHLELTNLHRRLAAASSFTDWLSGVIQERKPWTRDEYLDSIRRGAGMALASGTTLIGDVSASGLSGIGLEDQKIRRVIFEEALGLAPERAPQARTVLEARLECLGSNPLLTSGVSPHAPYSVSPELFRAIAELARVRALPLATHLAETKSEIEFLQLGSGEFHTFLSRLGVLPTDWSPPRSSPVSYLENLQVLENSPLLIHCNYLDPDSISRIQRHRCSVVYCPRSHAFFGHTEHPVRRLLDAGINVAIGTDSLASNDSLSMLDEIRFLRQARNDLKPDEILRMATINGASALGFGRVLGRLRRGAWADMAVLRLPENVNPKYLWAQVLEGLGEPAGTIVRGEIAWDGAKSPLP